MRLIETGELLPSMTQNFEKAFEYAIEKNKHRREPYYILATGNWYKNGEQLRMTVSPRSERPPKMLNTMCWRIDNKTGECKQLWVLPLDAPTQPIEPGPVSESIAESAQGIPIIYG